MDSITEQNAEAAEETMSEQAENYGWEYILSEVKDCLPAIDSDSEASTLADESDPVFQRKIATFDNTDSDSDIGSINNFSKPGSDKQDNLTLNSEGYGSASSSSPTSNLSLANPKSVTNDDKIPGINPATPSSSEYSALLFQRLHNHLKDNVQAVSDDKDDLHLTDMDLELPIYEDDKAAFYEGAPNDQSPPPMDLKRVPSQALSCEDSSGVQSRAESDSSGTEVRESQRKAPVLSLRGLEGFDLDELLEEIWDEDAQGQDSSLSPRDTNTADSERTGIMNQLVGLSKTQKGSESKQEAGDSQHFLDKRHFKDEPGGSENSDDILEKADIEDNKEVKNTKRKPSTSSCGVSANFSSASELSWSEPTTIFLDLRPKTELDEITNDEECTSTEKEAIRNEKTDHSFVQSKSTGMSTISNDQVSQRVKSLTRIRTMTRQEEDDDSESDDDDYKEWQAMRHRIKERSSLSAAASPKSRALAKDPKSLERIKKSLSKIKKVSYQISSQNRHTVEKVFGENIAGIKHIDLSFDDKVESESSLSKESSQTSLLSAAHEENGIYARQRLKNDESPKHTMPAPKSSLKNEANANAGKGKITVSFAEEPKKGDDDTTNVYRAKNLSSSSAKPTENDDIEKLTTCSTSSVQTDDSFAISEPRITFHDVVENILKNGELELDNRQAVTDKQIERQSILAKKQYDRVRELEVPSYSDRQVVRETRLKLKILLGKEAEKLGDPSHLLYDMDASFDKEVLNVPPELNTEQAQMVLLTINMSSTGCIVTHRNSGGHKSTPVDSNIGFSITYPMLLSWLLALVPEDLKKLHQARMDETFAIDIDPDLVPELTNGKDGPSIPISVDVPFNVVALHQSWVEDTQSLALQALVIPNFFYKPEAKRGRKKAKKEDAFLQVVWHFLQSNRIQDVCPWHEKAESPIHYLLSEIIITCATKPLSTYVSASNDPLLIKKALKNKPGFFCKQMSPDDQVSSTYPSSDCGKLQTTMCLLQKEAFMFPVAVMDIMIRLQTSCFDLAGLRLTYTTREFVNDNTLYHTSLNRRDPSEVVPCVVMAIRGRSVIARWSKIVGPRDPVLARMSERMSLNATYGEQLSIKRGDESLPTDVNMFCYPRSETRATHQLCMWFGGRIDVESRPFDKMLQNNINSFLAASGGSSKKPDKIVSNGKGNGKNGKNKSRNNSTNGNEQKENAPTAMGDLMKSPSYIVTCCNTRLFLVVSPRLPTQFISDVLHTVTQQGFQLHGIRRFRLNERKAGALSISPRYFPCFCPRIDADMPVDVDYYEDMWWLRPATILLLTRENATAHQAGLVHALQSDLMVNLSPPEEEGHVKVITYQCFHTTPYTEAIEHSLGSLTKVPDVELSSGSSPRSFYSNPEMEQVTVLSILGDGAIDGCGEVLRGLLHGEFPFVEDEKLVSQMTDDETEIEAFRGFELLGLKWLPSLSGMQANELTPFEVGTSVWHESIPLLQSSPVMLCVLRRVNAFEVLEDAMRLPRYSHSTVTKLDPEKFTHIMSITPEIAYRQMKMFFSDKELFPDNQSRPLLKYLPPPTRVHQYRQQQNGKLTNGDLDINGGGDQQNSSSNGSARSSENSKKSSKKKKKQNARRDSNNNNNNYSSNGSNNTSFTLPEESIFSSMVSCQQPLISVLVIKPDAFPRHFIKIFKQLHLEGFKVVAAKVIKMSEDEALQILPAFLKDMQGEVQVYLDHMTSGLSLVACVQRDNAIKHLCQLAGPHNPRVARSRCYSSSSTSRATWRALFGIDNISNGIHISDSYLSACEEMKRFFPDGLCCRETLELQMELVPTPAEDKFMCIDKMKGREAKVLQDDRQTNHTSSLRVTYMPRKPIVLILTPPLFYTTGSNRSRPNRHPLTQRPLRQAQGVVPPFVEILDQLLTQGFEICTMRMVWFAESQAVDILNILNFTKSRDRMVNTMTGGASLLLILQRENALVLFDSILGSTKSNGDSLYHKYSDNILRSHKEQETMEAARFLFPRIPCSDSVLSISHKRAMEWKEMNGQAGNDDSTVMK